MTRMLEFTKAHHLSTLHDELVAAGYQPWPMSGEDPARPFHLELGFPDDFADEAGVAVVVAAHDRAAAQAAWQAARQAEADEDAALDQRLADLDTALTVLAGSPSPAQLKAATEAIGRATRVLVRLALRRRGA